VIQRAPMDRQLEVYEFIRQEISAGCPPTVREICEHIGVRSPHGVTCHLNALERFGFIERPNSLSRNIRLTGSL